MKFCSHCGHSLEKIQLPEKTNSVICCSACKRQFQQHPKLLVAAFVHCGDKLLWMRRALPPQKGFWAIPAGFMEQGETLAQAAARELFEETGVVIAAEKMQLYMMGTISFISEVYIAFHAEVDTEFCQTCEESLDVAFFSREQLPWDQVAYPQANNSINQAYDDIAAGKFEVYHAEMTSEKNRLIPVSKTRPIPQC